jgi:hypothetical protein
VSDEKKVTIQLTWEDAKKLHEILDVLQRVPAYADTFTRIGYSTTTLQRLKAAVMAAEPERRIL